MLKIVQSKEEAMNLVKDLKSTGRLEGFRIGLTGSFADETNKKSSAIEIVLKAEESLNQVGSMEIIKVIDSFMKEFYHNKYEVVWLDLLEEDELELIQFHKDNGLDPNSFSIYTRVVDLAHWVNEEGEN